MEAALTLKVTVMHNSQENFFEAPIPSQLTQVTTRVLCLSCEEDESLSMRCVDRCNPLAVSCLSFK